MPLDAIFTTALTAELKAAIAGGRIDKVQQPSRDMLLVSLRNLGGNIKLLIRVGAGSARVHITEESFPNPAEPPMFCMLMRKHLIGAHIIDVWQPQTERMIVIELKTRDELGYEKSKKLIVEMIGRSSNLVLVDSDGRIIDCMRRMDFAGDAERRLLPGMIYRDPPKQNKLPIDSADDQLIMERIAAADREVPIDRWLIDNFSGLSPLLCRELDYSCHGDFELLPDSIAALKARIAAADFVPVMISDEAKPRDFSFMPIAQYADAMHLEYFDSFSELLDAFYSRQDRLEQQRRRGSELSRNVKTLRDRLQRKLSNQQEELRRTEGREALRINAELVTANIYRLKRGMRKLECENYYEPDCPSVSIELDPLKSPQENAAAMYKEYNKLKAAQQHLTKLIEQGERELEYLNSVLDVLSRAENERDIAEIRAELIDTGYIRQSKAARQTRTKKQEPYRFISDDGLEILAGRSNAQNDELTTKQARRTDFWLHTQKVHGSHVIIRCDGLEPPETTILQAASIAVYYSQARDGGKTAVDYTMVRNVRKPSGALPGMVIYTDYSTVLAQADEELIDRLKK